MLIAGDLEAEYLPFPYLVGSFVGLFGLFELLCLVLRFCGREARHIIVGVATATILAFFYRCILE